MLSELREVVNAAEELLVAAARLLLERVPISTLPPISFGVPTGIRTPVTAVKGRCPRPLDDGDHVTASVGWWR